MDLCVSFPSLNPLERTLILGELYRQSLIELGYSPDAHVYSLDREEIERSKKTVQRDYVLDVIDFYHSLSDFEARIYCCQILEHGRHFPFWWLIYKDETDYVSSYSSVIAKTNNHFC